MLWLDFHDWSLNLWTVILERKNIFSKKFLAQIITFGQYFGWFDVQLNRKTLDDLYYVSSSTLWLTYVISLQGIHFLAMDIKTYT